METKKTRMSDQGVVWILCRRWRPVGLFARGSLFTVPSMLCSVWTTAGSSRPGNWCSCNACISNTGRTGTLCRIFQIQLQSPYSPSVPCMRDQNSSRGVIHVILTSSQDDRWERADGILVEFYNPPPPPSLHI